MAVGLLRVCDRRRSALFVCTCTIRSSRDETATPVDWVGAVLIGGAVAIFVFGVVEAPVRGWTHPVVWGCMAAGVALALAFALVELRRTASAARRAAVQRPDFATGAVGITFLFFANFGFFFLAMQYMQLILGYSPLETAWALGPVAVPIIVLGATMHLILPRVGLRLVVSRRPLLDRRRAVQHAVPGSRLVLHRSRLAVPDHQRGHRTLRRTDDVGHHERRPDDKQGVASAVNDTTREVGAAVGIAVAGSVLAAQYTHAMAPGLARFPEHIRGAATDSLANALEIAKQLGPQGRAGAARRVGVPRCDGPFADRRVDSAGCGGGFRRGLGTRPGRSTARVRCAGSPPRRQPTTNSAARCPSITIVAWGPRPVTVGRTDPSTTHSRSTPRTLHRSSTTAAASPSGPIGAVAQRCCDVDHDRIADLC